VTNRRHLAKRIVTTLLHEGIVNCTGKGEPAGFGTGQGMGPGLGCQI
jgi:hypothetical protein